MKIDFSKATDEQLWTILSSDWDIPKEHLRPLVEEALRRKMFNDTIGYLAKIRFGKLSNEFRNNFDELHSVGLLGITDALNRYKNGKMAFSSFAYMNIETELRNYKKSLNAKMREHYKDMVSLDFSTKENQSDTLLNTLFDYSVNPERIVTKKIEWEERFSVLEEREKEILLYFANGYSLNEIGKQLGYAGHSTVRKRFKRAIGKINPNSDFSLRNSGLELKTKKGALA